MIRGRDDQNPTRTSQISHIVTDTYIFFHTATVEQERAAEVEKALVEEIENRKRHTESVLGMLQQKVSGEEDGRH